VPPGLGHFQETLMSKTIQLFDRDAIAKQYADRHLKVDPGVVEIHYLPTNAPAREIRFLEVNGKIIETSHLEPIDFGVDVEGVNHHVLLVLDITPTQWQAIQGGKLDLPEGWSLDNSMRFHKKRTHK
jgi:hypothetical protein